MINRAPESPECKAFADRWPVPILQGKRVLLAPLSHEHADALGEAVGSLPFLWYTDVPEKGAMHAEIDRRLALQAAGSMLPFAVIDQETGLAVGMTSFMNIDRAGPRVEIGSTWYSENLQRTGINTEAKLLLLGYAFDTLQCLAVEFRTHILNHQSRRAIERLRAKLDGILRNHRRCRNGTLRDTCVYSVTDAEWPIVQAHLTWQLTKPR